MVRKNTPKNTILYKSRVFLIGMKKYEHGRKKEI